MIGGPKLWLWIVIDRISDFIKTDTKDRVFLKFALGVGLVKLQE